MNSRTQFSGGLLILLLLTLGACTPERDPATLFAPEAVGVLVIDAVLIVGEPLPNIGLTRTLAPDVPYTLAAAHEAGAEIVIDGPAGDIRYREFAGEIQGRFVAYYGPVGAPPVVQPGSTYSVAVTTSGGERLTASTLTPTGFDIDDWVLLASDGQSVVRSLRTFEELGDDVYTHPDNRLDYAEGLVDGLFGQTAVDYGAFGFQVALFSLDPGADFVIDPPFLEEEDFADLPREGSSPILNGEDGSLRLPWFTIYYDGRHLYKTFAVDRNWFDLERTIPQGGGSFVFGGNVGEGVDPPIFHVEGGIGLFGSAAVDSVGFYVNPLE